MHEKYRRDLTYVNKLISFLFANYVNISQFCTLITEKSRLRTE